MNALLVEKFGEREAGIDNEPEVIDYASLIPEVFGGSEDEESFEGFSSEEEGDERADPEPHLEQDEIGIYQELSELVGIELHRIQQEDTVERKTLQKMALTAKEIKVLNKICYERCSEVTNLRDLVDSVYAVAKVANDKLAEVPTKKRNPSRPSKSRKNRRATKLQTKIKDLKGRASIITNEIQRRKSKRSMSAKEKREFKKVIEVLQIQNTPSNALLVTTKTKTIDELKVMQIRLNKMEERSKKIRSNIMFQKNESAFYRKLGEDKEKIGELPEVEKFVDFWADIWEKEGEIKQVPWMDEVKEMIEERINRIGEVCVTEEMVGKIIKKRKNWTSPGVDGIQNYWWKKLKSTWRPLSRIFIDMFMDNRKIPDWIGIGRTALLPKTSDISKVDEYRPITCLLTIYKIFTGIISKNMVEHMKENNIWDERQLGTRDKVLGTVDHLLVDKCVLEEVKEQKRNLNVVYYDYRKAYDMVSHKWMDMVFKWLKFPDEILSTIRKLRMGWRVKLEVRNGDKLNVSREIAIKKGFLQGDSWSPIGFCLSELPIGMMLSDTKGYMMGAPSQRDTSLTHSLFIDDLKTYQKSHEEQIMVNEMLVKMSTDIGAIYGVKKCAEIAYVRGQVEKTDGLKVLEEVMPSLEYSQCYKFLGIEEGDGVLSRKVKERVKVEMIKRVELLTDQLLVDKNLMKSINTHALPVVSYVMNVINFGKTELKDLDNSIKKVLRAKNMLGRRSSDERLYLKKEKGGRGLKSFVDIYNNTKLRVAVYIWLAEDKYLKKVKQREERKEFLSLFKIAGDCMESVGAKIEFKEEKVFLNSVALEGDVKNITMKVKDAYAKRSVEKRGDDFKKKETQSKSWTQQQETSFLWMQRNVMPEKMAAVIEMCEGMVDTRVHLKLTGRLPNDEILCRLCGRFAETLQHWLSGCEYLCGTEYVERHNKALMVFAHKWAVNEELVADGCWYKVKWKKGEVLENAKRRLRWDYEYNTTVVPVKSRRPDLVLEYIEEKEIHILDMSCPQEDNVNSKETEKLRKYQQLAYELRIRNPGWKVVVYPLVIGSMGKVESICRTVEKYFGKKQGRWIVAEMQRVVVMESESLIRKIKSGLLRSNLTDNLT